jgi:hypothetical protein
MPSSTLAAYTIRVRFKGKRTTERLGHFGEPEGQAPVDPQQRRDLFPILIRYLTELQDDADRDEENKKWLEVGDVTPNNDLREITGIINHGEWGFAAPGKNFRTGALNYQRDVEDVEPLPFYYLLSIPEDGRIGFAILQRFGPHGIRGPLLDYFQRKFKEEYPDFRINIEMAAPGELIEQYIRAGALVKKVSFVQFRLPRNFEDRYGNRDAVKEAYGEYVIHAKRGGLPILGDIRNAIQRRANGVARLVEIAPGGNANVIKVNIEVNGKAKSLDIHPNDPTVGMRAYHDITREVVLGRNGLPTFESVDVLARALLAKQYEGLGQ